MFGAHLSIAGGMVKALDAARRLRMDCVQVFTRNQRQWNVKPLAQADREAWLAALTDLGWHRRRGAARTVSHASYLINLASPDRALWRRSIALHREELDRCEALRIPLCVLHPGAHKGEPRSRTDPGGVGPPRGVTADELAGLRRVVKALDRVHRELPGYRVTTCLETTAGAGTVLGGSFEHLAYIGGHLAEPKRVAWCFDTCHVTAAGYDMTTPRRAAEVLARFNAVCGHRHLRVLHLNDSVGAVGSHRDRHAHIGFGACGLPCFRAVVNCPGLALVPKIIETPKGTDEKGLEWDLRNIRRLKRLVCSRR